MLRRNLALNPALTRIRAIEAAATASERSLEVPLRESYATSKGRDGASPRTVTVPGVPIGVILGEMPRVDLLKIDIEGGEYEILRAISTGAWETIREVRMEFHAGLQDLPQLFESHGFRVTASLGVRQGLLNASRVR